MKTTTFRAALFGLAGACSLSTLFGCNGRISIASGSPLGFNSNTVKQSKAASGRAQGASKLRCDTSFGSIDCRSEGDKVDVKAEVSASGPQSKEILTSWLDKTSISLNRDGSTLVVALKKPDG